MGHLSMRLGSDSVCRYKKKPVCYDLYPGGQFNETQHSLRLQV